MILGAFALVSLQVDLSRRSEALTVAQDIIETFPGTRNVSFDSGVGSVSFELIFPGNLSALIARLESNLIPVGERAAISLPVRSLVPEILASDGEMVKRTLEDGPEIWDVAFRRGHYVYDASLIGDRVDASIVPSSNSMHQLYDSLLKLGLVADGEATPAPGG